MGSVGSLPRRFPLFSFFCLLVSSVSDFRPDTRRVVVDTFFFFLGSLVQSRCGEGGMLQTNSTVVCTVSQPRWACPCSRCTNCSGSTMLSREQSEASPRLRAPPQSKTLRFSSQVALRGADLSGTAFRALPRSKWLRSLVSAVTATCRLSRHCCSVFWVDRWRPL